MLHLLKANSNGLPWSFQALKKFLLFWITKIKKSFTLINLSSRNQNVSNQGIKEQEGLGPVIWLQAQMPWTAYGSKTKVCQKRIKIFWSITYYFFITNMSYHRWSIYCHRW